MKGSIKLWISIGITIIGWIIYLYPCLAIIVFASIFAILILIQFVLSLLAISFWIVAGENYTIDEDTPLLQLFYINPIHWVILAIIKINKLANKYLSD